MLIEMTRRFHIDAHRDADMNPVTWIKDTVTGARAVLYPEFAARWAASESLEAAVAYIAEAQFAARITRHHNGECCCETCEPAYCYDCSHYADFCTCPAPVSLWKSPFRSDDYAAAGEPPF